MCTVTFTYDGRNAKARRMIHEIRQSGLFQETNEKPNNTTRKAINDAREHKDLQAVDMASFDTFLSSMGL